MPKAIDLKDDTMLDIFEAGIVGIQISADSTRVWVCVDGVCRFRVKGQKTLEVDDMRPIILDIE